MALQLADAAGGGEVTLVSMAPNGETGGLRTALAMGAAKAMLVCGSRAQGHRRARHREGARRGDLDHAIRPHPHRHRVDGRLHRARRPCSSPSSSGLPSVTFAKSVAVDGSTVRVERQTEAGFDEVTCAAARRRHGDRWRRRAALPVVQGDHGGQVQARHRAAPSPTSASTARWARPARARRSWRSRPTEARAQGEIVDDEGDGAARIVAVPRVLEGHLATCHRARSTACPSEPSGSLAEPTSSGITTPSLELLTAARGLAESVEAITLGTDGRPTPRCSASTGRPRSTTSATSAPRSPACPVAAAIAGLVAAAGAPDAILVPTSYDGRDVAGRLSVRLDRPVLTNVTGLRGDGGLVAEHPVFGGTLTVVLEVHLGGTGDLRHPREELRGRALRGRCRHRRRARGARDTGATGTATVDAATRRSERAVARRGVRRGLGGPRARRGLGLRDDRGARARCCTARRARAAPSSTPAGCRTRTRWARRARR